MDTESLKKEFVLIFPLLNSTSNIGLVPSCQAMQDGVWGTVVQLLTPGWPPDGHFSGFLALIRVGAPNRFLEDLSLGISRV